MEPVGEKPRHNHRSSEFHNSLDFDLEIHTFAVVAEVGENNASAEVAVEVRVATDYVVEVEAESIELFVVAGYIAGIGNLGNDEVVAGG